MVELPQVLVLRPVLLLKMFEKQFQSKFSFLKAWESPMPTTLFLKTHAQSVKAILCTAGTPITSDVLSHLPAVQLVVTENTGVDHIDLQECWRLKISVTNAATVFCEDVADMGVGMLLAVLRRICSDDRFLRGGLWPNSGDIPLGSKLGGKRVGIVGLGSIGSKVGKRLEAFGCNISYTSRKKKSETPYLFYPTVHELASNCNVLILCCSLTDQTRHMINKEVMAALGKEGIIINIGRGPIIDEKELVKCLLEGQIAGAGLDVFENEPYVPKELFGLENVVLSPHRAAFTEEAILNAFQLAVANLEAFFSGKPLLSPVINE
ncbi:unnamed protein product [Ilex paraguariensis]|uniref:Uncharacterized protein n=1 Tax=Ilex paraguariensis TaxID=185542 RepID=A0ABC8RLF3_9AQUA